MSEYSELVKNYNKIREYLRDFYIYGFRSRDSFVQKSSGRSYDNERRRIESYLGDLVCSRIESEGKKIFITADASSFFENPLYKTFKCKSFTKNDVTLHFAVLYVLEKYGASTLADIDGYIFTDVLSYFDEGAVFDVATIRNKLKEYEKDGIVKAEKAKGKMVYSLAKREDLSPLFTALSFYTSVFPLGVIGSFIMDKNGVQNTVFTNKHTYFASTLDSEIIIKILVAIANKKAVQLIAKEGARKKNKSKFVPFKVAITVQSGRNYLLGFSVDNEKYTSVRLDGIEDVIILDDAYADYDDLKSFYEQKMNNVWGVSLQNAPSKYLEVHIRYKKGEEYIVERVKREKRIGSLEIEEGVCKLRFDIVDIAEIVPWLRTFIGRIEYMKCSDKRFVKKFYSDIEEMKKLYGVES